MSKITVAVNADELSALQKACEEYTHINISQLGDKVYIKFFKESGNPLLIQFSQYTGD